MSPIPGAFAVICVLLVATAAIGMAVNHWRARRNDRQVEDHIRLRDGMKTAQRMGWLPEDLQ